MKIMQLKMKFLFFFHESLIQSQNPKIKISHRFTILIIINFYGNKNFPKNLSLVLFKDILIIKHIKIPKESTLHDFFFVKNKKKFCYQQMFVVVPCTVTNIAGIKHR